MASLLLQMHSWISGSVLEQRAVVAALCEPILLSDPIHAREVLFILDHITTGILNSSSRKAEDFRILRQALGYGWSVAVAALPQEGQDLLEKWSTCLDKDIRWIMKENLKKKRLARMDAAWVERWLNYLE